MKKIILFLTIMVSMHMYSQSTMQIMQTHTRMAQQAMNQHRNFMNMQIRSSLSNLDVLKNNVKKTEGKLDNLNIKLQKEERKLAELQNTDSDDI